MDEIDLKSVAEVLSNAEELEGFVGDAVGELMFALVKDERISPNEVLQGAIELQDIVRNAARTTAASALASFVPVVGPMASFVGAMAGTWYMYVKINEKLGIKFSENALKTIATGIGTNLASYAAISLAGSTIMSFIPIINFASPLVMAALIYAGTSVSGVIYLGMMSMIFGHGLDPSSLSDDDLVAIRDEVLDEYDVEAAMDEMKQEYKQEKENA